MLTFGALAVGVLPAPRPCAAVVVLSAATATAVVARSENLRISGVLPGTSDSKKGAHGGRSGKRCAHKELADSAHRAAPLACTTVPPVLSNLDQARGARIAPIDQ